jgi:hypothetical protein
MASKYEACASIIEYLSENRQTLENWALVVKRWGSVEALAEYQKKNVTFPDTTLESAQEWSKSVAEKIAVIFEKVDSVNRHSRPADKAHEYFDTWILFIQSNKSTSATARKLGLFHNNGKPNAKEIRDRLSKLWLDMKSSRPQDSFSDNYLVDMRLDGDANIVNFTYWQLSELAKKALDND